MLKNVSQAVILVVVVVVGDAVGACRSVTEFRQEPTAGKRSWVFCCTCGRQPQPKEHMSKTTETAETKTKPAAKRAEVGPTMSGSDILVAGPRTRRRGDHLRLSRRREHGNPPVADAIQRSAPSCRATNRAALRRGRLRARDRQGRRVHGHQRPRRDEPRHRHRRRLHGFLPAHRHHRPGDRRR